MNEPSNMAAMPTAVVIKMRLRPGVEQGFSSWHAKMCTVAAELPGFISAKRSWLNRWVVSGVH